MMKQRKKPKDKEEIRKFIYKKLKAKYGDNVLSDKVSKNVVVDTETNYRGNSDVWISLEYFH